MFNSISACDLNIHICSICNVMINRNGTRHLFCWGTLTSIYVTFLIIVATILCIWVKNIIYIYNFVFLRCSGLEYTFYQVVDGDLRALVTEVFAQVRINATKSLHSLPGGPVVQRFSSIYTHLCRYFCH